MMKNNRLLVVQGALYTLIATLTPTLTLLGGENDLTTRALLVLGITSLISGATALKAFLSTTFADSPASTNSLK